MFVPGLPRRLNNKTVRVACFGGGSGFSKEEAHLAYHSGDVISIVLQLCNEFVIIRQLFGNYPAMNL
jgi:hypothetical protein